MIHSGHQLLYSPLSQLFVAELLRGKVDRGEALFRQKNNFRRGELNVFKILYADGKAAAQRGQARNFPIQRRCAGSEQRFQRGSIPRRKRRGNLVQRKPQIAQQADKMEISRLFGGITAITVAVHMDGAEKGGEQNMKTRLYPMVQFKKDTWEIDEFECASVFVLVGKEKAMVIDAGIGIGDLIGAIRMTITDKPLVIVATHGHGDHTGGMGNFDEYYLSEKDWFYPVEESIEMRRGYSAMIAKRQGGYYP